MLYANQLDADGHVHSAAGARAQGDCAHAARSQATLPLSALDERDIQVAASDSAVRASLCRR